MSAPGDTTTAAAQAEEPAQTAAAAAPAFGTVSAKPAVDPAKGETEEQNKDAPAAAAAAASEAIPEEVPNDAVAAAEAEKPQEADEPEAKTQVPAPAPGPDSEAAKTEAALAEEQAVNDSMFADEDSDEDAPKVVLKRKRKRVIDDKNEQPPPKKFNSLGARVPRSLASRPKTTASKQEKIDDLSHVLPPDEGVNDNIEFASDEPFKGTPEEDEAEAMDAEDLPGQPIPSPAAEAETFVHPELPYGMGGTPVDNQGRSLLYWSETGSIKRTGDEGTLLYEIEHGDGTISFRSQNYFVKGAVGRTGYVMASSTGIKVKQFGRGKDRWASDWEIDVISGESITACCVTNDHVAVCTEKNGHMLRLYSLGGGICTSVMCLPGAPVICAGGGDRLAVFFNSGSVLRLLLLDMAKQTRLCEIPVCLGGHNQITDSPSLMKWCHMSATDRLYILDDTNTMRMLARQFDMWTWVPVLELKSNAEVEGPDKHHPHSVEDSKADAEFFYAPIPNSGILPLAPRPMLSKMPLRIPNCTITESPVEKLFRDGEEGLLRKDLWYKHEMFSSNISKAKLTKKRNKQLDRALVTMFTQAAGHAQAPRCVDLARRIQLKTVLEGAASLAYEHGLPRVSEQLQALLRERAAAAASVLAASQPGAALAASSSFAASLSKAAPKKQVPAPAAASTSKPSSRPGSAPANTTFGKKMFGVAASAAAAAPEPVVQKKRKTNPFSRK